MWWGEVCSGTSGEWAEGSTGQIYWQRENVYKKERLHRGLWPLSWVLKDKQCSLGRRQRTRKGTGTSQFGLHIDAVTIYINGFPNSSVGKESACNAGDPTSIPGSGISPGEGIGYPLQYSWASLVAQLLKNLPATWETWVQSLGWEDPLEKGKGTHSSILAWRIPWTIQS